MYVDVLDKPVGNGFKDWKDPSGTYFQVRLFTDAQNNLHLWIVPSVSLDQLTKEQLMEMFVYASAQVVSNSDQRVPGCCQNLVNYVPLLTDPKYPPFIDINPEQ